MPPTAFRIGCTSPTIDKAKELDPKQLDELRSPYTQMSVRLADDFGLRREACIKMVPGKADQGDVLVLKASWNKGGREIRVPIRTPEQRQLLDEAKALAKGKSLVAPGYAPTTRTSSTSAPSASGSASTASTAIAIATRSGATTSSPVGSVLRGAGRRSKQLTKKQKERDREVRLQISHEMGHGREPGDRSVSRKISTSTTMTTPAHSMPLGSNNRFDSAGVMSMRTPRAATATP